MGSPTNIQQTQSPAKPASEGLGSKIKKSTVKSTVTGVLVGGTNFALKQTSGLLLGRTVTLGSSFAVGGAAATIVVVFQLVTKIMEIAMQALNSILSSQARTQINKGLDYIKYPSWENYAVTALKLAGSGAAVYFAAPLAGVSLSVYQVALLTGLAFMINKHATPQVENFLSKL